MAEPLQLYVGFSPWQLTVLPERAVELRRAAVTPPSASAAELTREALEHPVGFEAMRRALTPDDHVTIVLDPSFPAVPAILGEVLTHLRSGGVQPEAVTILTPPGSSQSWVDDLPDEFAEMQTEVHDPTDPKKLAYLASTKADHRVYLNRTLVDADFSIVVTGRRFDPVRSYAGATVAVYPDLADEEIRAANAGPYTAKAPWPGREESLEVAWLLGTPFLVQVIEGEGDTVQEVVAGLLDTEPEGRRRQDTRWKGTVSEEPDTVIAAVGGDPARITFLDLAKAAASAARVVRKGGRIAVLTAAAPDLGDGARLLRSTDDPTTAKKLLAKEKPDDWAACAQWCRAAKDHSLFLASGYPDDVAEELFATPIHTAGEVQRLIDSAERVLVIPDAHKTKVTVEV